MMEHIAEPTRMNLLNILRNNLKAANRSTFLHRIIYIANHCFPNYRTTDDIYQKCINKVNEGYVEEKVSGLLLYYPEYFCHVLESSEYGIHQTLIELFTNEEIKQYIHTRKLLAVYHNINQRLLEDWRFYSDKPPTLLEKIEINVDRQIATRYIYNCTRKLYGLIIRLRPSEEEANYEMLDLLKSASVSFQNPTRVRLTDYLPEYSLLDFLLKTEHTEDLENYLSTHGHVPEGDISLTMVWPPMPSYVPFNVFDSFKDPIEDLPPRECIKLKPIEIPEVKKKDTDY